MMAARGLGYEGGDDDEEDEEEQDDEEETTETETESRASDRGGGFMQPPTGSLSTSTAKKANANFGWDYLKKFGFRHGTGLGAKRQGITSAITAIQLPTRVGLGFESKKKKKKKGGSIRNADVDVDDDDGGQEVPSSGVVATSEYKRYTGYPIFGGPIDYSYVFNYSAVVILDPTSFNGGSFAPSAPSSSSKRRYSHYGPQPGTGPTPTNGSYTDNRPSQSPGAPFPSPSESAYYTPTWSANAPPTYQPGYDYTNQGQHYPAPYPPQQPPTAPQYEYYHYQYQDYQQYQQPQYQY